MEVKLDSVYVVKSRAEQKNVINSDKIKLCEYK